MAQSPVQFLKEKFFSNRSEIGWFFAGHAGIVLLTFLIVKILSSLGKEEFGVYSLIQSVAILATMIWFTPYQQAFLRFYPEFAESTRRRAIIKVMVNFVFYSSLLLLLFTIAATLIGAAIETEILALLILGGLLVTFLSATDFFNAALNLARKRKQYALLRVGEFAAISAVLLLLQRVELLTLDYALVILAAGYLGFAVWKYVVFLRNEQPPGEADTEAVGKYSTEAINKATRYAVPFLVWGGAFWLQQNGERWIIAEMLSTADLGVYAVMLALVNGMVHKPGTVINEFMMPVIFGQFAGGGIEQRAAGAKYILSTNAIIVLLALGTAVFTWFTGEWLIVFISSEAYTGFAYLLPLLCLGAGILQIAQTMCNYGYALKQPGRYMAPKVISGLITPFIIAGGIYLYALDGVAYGLLAANSFYLLLIWITNRKITRDATVQSEEAANG